MRPGDLLQFLAHCIEPPFSGPERALLGADPLDRLGRDHFLLGLPRGSVAMASGTVLSRFRLQLRLPEMRSRLEQLPLAEGVRVGAGVETPSSPSR
jgi:hypothetical protein